MKTITRAMLSALTLMTTTTARTNLVDMTPVGWDVGKSDDPPAVAANVTWTSVTAAIA